MPQRRRIAFIAVRKDALSVVARTRGYRRAEQMADCSTLWVRDTQNASVRDCGWPQMHTRRLFLS